MLVIHSLSDCGIVVTFLSCLSGMSQIKLRFKTLVHLKILSWKWRDQGEGEGSVWNFQKWQGYPKLGGCFWNGWDLNPSTNYVFVQYLVEIFFKAYFIIISISKHIFWKINTCVIKKNVIISKALSNFIGYIRSLTRIWQFLSGKYIFLGNKLGTPCFRFSEFLWFWDCRNSWSGIC